MKKKSQSAPQSDERLELLFRHAGLSEKQAKLYRLLLITGDERPSTLARKSGIKRANTYALLDDMARRGLVMKFEKENITYFRPEPPSKLVDIIEARKKETAIAQDLADDLIPNLTSQYKASISRPVVQTFEGEKGLWNVFYDIYSPDTPDIYGCVDFDKVHNIFPDHITKELIPRRIKHKTKAYALLSDSPEARKTAPDDANHLRVSTILDNTLYPLPAEIEVYKDKIALMSFEHQEFIALVIDNPVFATTLRSIIKWVIDHRTDPPSIAQK
jgi:sugar-specific transcriptional regulator TrmB